jgi:hypothetical protein
MFLKTPVPFVKEFVDELNTALQTDQPGRGLSRLQRLWLAFCLTGIVVTHSVCWARLARAGLGTYSLAAVSWIFRKATMPWGRMLQMRVTVMLEKYGIPPGALVVDDADKKRGTVTTRIFNAHTLHDKTSGGSLNGQNLVLWVLVPSVVTMPVGFALYRPDPALTAWNKEDKQDKKRGVPPNHRPPQPSKHPAYPTNQAIALALREEFRRTHPTMAVPRVLADALYGTHQCMEQAAKLCGTQVISQLHTNQHVRFRHTHLSLERYFTQAPGVPPRISIRGAEAVTVMVSRARL